MEKSSIKCRRSQSNPPPTTKSIIKKEEKPRRRSKSVVTFNKNVYYGNQPMSLMKRMTPIMKADNLAERMRLDKLANSIDRNFVDNDSRPTIDFQAEAELEKVKNAILSGHVTARRRLF
jgi:hypothetical protein